MDRGNNRYFYHADHQGSIIGLSDSVGNIVQTYQYGPFGEGTRADPFGNPYRYTARRFDQESGLYYYRARYYDPVLGRFLQPDPSGYADGLNLYAYVGNSPLSYNDPFGLTAKEIASGGYGLLSSAGHTTLDVAGLVFDPADSINAAWYLGEGNYEGAAYSGAAQVPGIGVFATLGKWGKKATKRGGTVDVYRAFGGDARAQGFSWTTKDPRAVSNFRDAAGLPSGGASGSINTANFLIKGKVNAADIIKRKSADPLDGNKGGLPELIIDPKNVNITDFSVLKP